jgi:hypothetical protein
VIGCSLFSYKLTLLANNGDVHQAANFNTFGTTLRTMFQLLLGDFTNVMYAGIDAYGSLWPGVYFILFAIIMALIFTNLVIGVVCDLYLSEVYAPILGTVDMNETICSSVDSSSNSSSSSKKTIEDPTGIEKEFNLSDVLKLNAELSEENLKLIAALKMTKMKRAIPHILRKRSTYTL